MKLGKTHLSFLRFKVVYPLRECLWQMWQLNHNVTVCKERGYRYFKLCLGVRDWFEISQATLGASYWSSPSHVMTSEFKACDQTIPHPIL